MEFEGRARIHSHLDIAPLIDIVFLLLVFFMLTSRFVVPEAIEMDLPTSSSARVMDNTTISISMNATGELTLNGQHIALEQLRAAISPLLAQAPGTAITLKSDAHTEVQLLLQVMDEIRAAGASHIALATRQK